MTDLLDFFESRGPYLLRLLYRVTLREDVAEDLLQELFLKLRASEGFRAAANRSAYARGAALHLAFDWRRDQRRCPITALPPDESLAAASSPLQRLIEEEEIQTVLDLMADLPTAGVELLTMRYLQQDSYETIGHQLGKTAHQARALPQSADSVARPGKGETACRSRKGTIMNDHSPERLAQLLEQLAALEPRPEAIDRALERTRQALGDVSVDNQRAKPRNPRRGVSRFLPRAAAAAILVLLALALVSSLTVSNLGSRSAFAQVQSALKNVPSMRYQLEVLESTPKTSVEKTKVICDFLRMRERQESIDGAEVLIWDDKSGTVLRLFPRQKVAISMKGPKNDHRAIGSDFGGFVENLRNADPKAVQHLPDRELDGRRVNQYRLPPDSPLANGSEWLFFVDPQTQLPVRVEGIVRDKSGAVRVRLACTEFSFRECDASLFELTPPEGYQLQKFEDARSEPVAMAPLPGPNATIAFELRLAESTAGDGLTEASVDKTDLKVYLHAKPVITRQDIQEARLLKDETNGDVIIELTLTAKGAERLSEATSQNQNKLLAILINGRVIAAPRIFATLSNSFQIMGSSFTAAEASDIVRGLRPATP